MLWEIKNKIEGTLRSYLKDSDTAHSLNAISPILYKNIKEFALRKGKRLRPLLFILGYLGFAKKTAAGLYTSAVSIELLHDFMLVHDDIIDKSKDRRGKPSMHELFNQYLSKYKNLKFNGEDLSIVVGDVLYALALEAFLSIKEKLKRKEKALRRFIQTAMHTASGEFVELLYGVKGIEKITKEDIYKIYDLKTANYTFSSPLAIGATLAGAKEKEIKRLFQYGTYLGRAFQIKDDISEGTLTDLQEAKKTLLIWYAYNNSGNKNKAVIKTILAKPRVNRPDLLKMRKIVIESGALDFARKKIASFFKKADSVIKTSKMLKQYKDMLSQYTLEIIGLP